MRTFVTAILCWAMAASGVLAQTVPYGPITGGQIWTPTQWNYALAHKQDYPIPTITVAGGGTGQTTFTAHGVLLGEGTSGLGNAGPGTSGYCLTSAGSSSDPVWAVCGSGGASYGINFNGQELVTTSTTLSSSDSPHNILVSGSGITLTLPSNTLTFALNNAGSSVVTLSFPVGTDWAGGNSLYPGQQVILSGDGAGFWRVVSTGDRTSAPAGTLLGNNTGSANAVAPLTVAQASALLQGQTSGTLAAGNDPRFAGPVQNVQTTSYTLALSDAGGQFYYNSASAGTLTIPANSSVAFGVVTKIDVVNDCGNGLLTISITSDTLVYLPSGGTGSRTLAACGEATLTKVGTTRWLITGTGLS